MKIARAFLLALILVLALSVAAVMPRGVNTTLNCSSVPAPKVQHACQHQLGDVAGAFKSGIQRIFGLGEIWIRVKCQLDSLAGPRKANCN
jgi:hypothetical protein